MPSIALADPMTSAARFQRSLGRLMLGREDHSPAWEEPTLKALASLLLLPPNWDSYGARAIDPTCVWTAWEVLTRVMPEAAPLPAVVPTVRGGVQLEWHCHGVDLEIEVTGPHELAVSFAEDATGKTWEKTGDIDVVMLTAAVDRLRAQDLQRGVCQ